MRGIMTTVAGVCVSALMLTSCFGGEDTRSTRITLGNSTDVVFFDTKATMTVDDVVMDFFPTNGKVLTDPKESDAQFVRVGLTFHNDGAESFKMNYTNVTLDTPTQQGTMMTVLINDSNADDLLKSHDLGQGESVSGAMYFEVPAAVAADQLTVSYRGYENMESKEFKVPLGR